MLEALSSPQGWLGLITLAALEIVLGVDNIIFLSILVVRLPPERRRTARVTGLSLAMLTRVALLVSIVWLTSLREPWLHFGPQAVSARDLILFCGGLFLLGKGVLELHHTVEGATGERPARTHASFARTVVQIALIDIVFSLDSVFTAVGLSNQLQIMVTAIVISMVVMMWVSGSISSFIERHMTIKVLALAFLILIGVALLAESLHFEIPKGYIYFAMAFAAGVELINVRLRR